MMETIGINHTISTSLYSDTEDDDIKEVMISCQSISFYDSKQLKTLLPQIFAAICSAAFHVVYGISLAYSAILLPQLNEQAQNSSSSIQITETEGAWIASVIVIVVPFAAIAGGFIMDFAGRLNLIKIAAIPSVLGWILIAMATNIAMLISGRILIGIASVWGSSPALVYITEIAHKDMRASLICIAPAFSSLGLVLTYLKGWFLDWRIVAWLSVAYSIITALMVFLIPESPSWLISRQRKKEAKEALEWLHKYQPEYKTTTFAEMQLYIMQKENLLKQKEHAKVEGNHLSKMAKMFLQPTGYKPLLILTGLYLFQQFSGTYIIVFYTVTFFENVGTNINPYLASILVGLVRFCMSVGNTWLMKRFPIRELTMVSALAMAACMGISGLFTQWIRDGTTNQNWVPVLMLVIYVITSMFGLLTIPWNITAELFPLAIRGVGHAIAFSIANLMMFASIQSFYSMNRFFGGPSGLQYFLAVVSLGGFVYSYIFLPETHKKKLSEIEEYFKCHTTYLSVKTNSYKANSDHVIEQTK